MPVLTEEMYCSQQICIPPSFPYLLRQYAKAAIRSQPTDLLKWSTAYFRCLSLNVPPPVKPRLEYPIPRDHHGITPGWLKALLTQFQNSLSVQFEVLWDRWIGACLRHETLIKILCLGGFTDNQAIPFLRFIGLCAGHLTDNLTQTMILVCEILTEEPEGGSAMIPLETFIDIYKFLAAINASERQVIRNIYFTDSMLNLAKKLRAKKMKRGDEEMETEVSSSKSSTIEEKTVAVVVRKGDATSVISCPSVVGDENLPIEQYLKVIEADAPPDEEHVESEDDKITDGDKSENTKKTDDVSELDQTKTLDDESRVTEDNKSKATADSIITEEGIEDEEKKSKIAEDEASEADKKSEVSKEIEASKQTEVSKKPVEEEKPVEEPQTPLVAVAAEENAESAILTEASLSASGNEVPEDDDSESISITNMGLKEYLRMECEHDYYEAASIKAASEQSVEEEEETRDVYIDIIPGIGPVVPLDLVDAVCEYLKCVSIKQHGMVMPRNIRHYNCPPLEVLKH